MHEQNDEEEGVVVVVVRVYADRREGEGDACISYQFPSPLPSVLPPPPRLSPLYFPPSPSFFIANTLCKENIGCG